MFGLLHLCIKRSSNYRKFTHYLCIHYHVYMHTQSIFPFDVLLYILLNHQWLLVTNLFRGKVSSHFSNWSECIPLSQQPSWWQACIDDVTSNSIHLDYQGKQGRLLASYYRGGSNAVEFCNYGRKNMCQTRFKPPETLTGHYQFGLREQCSLNLFNISAASIVHERPLVTKRKLARHQRLPRELRITDQKHGWYIVFRVFSLKNCDWI